MTNDYKLSLPAAILINVNIILGAGIFINTVELARRAGMFGFLAYGIIGILLLPLMLSIAHLIKQYPNGGFYTFASKEINTFAAFCSTWIYFSGKLASATLLIHTAATLFQGALAVLQPFNLFVIDGIILILFVLLNMLNIKTGRAIQMGIVTLKLIPVFFVIVTGIFFFNPNNFVIDMALLQNIPSTLPLVLFAVLGFEATCALSSQIQNPERNGPRAIFISYAIVICLVMLYQFFFYINIGPLLQLQKTYLSAFPALLATLFSSNLQVIHSLEILLYCAIATSALGGAYGIFFSNTWNLFILARNNHTFFSEVLTVHNRHFIPYMCIIIEGVVCVLYLLITKAAQIPLQQISALSSVVAYTISIYALYKAKKRVPSLPIYKGTISLAFFNCALLFAASMKSFITYGMMPLGIFATVCAIGIGMYWKTSAPSLSEL
jgi:amino acid transporter